MFRGIGIGDRRGGDDGGGGGDGEVTEGRTRCWRKEVMGRKRWGSDRGGGDRGEEALNFKIVWG